MDQANAPHPRGGKILFFKWGLFLFCSLSFFSLVAFVLFSFKYMKFTQQELSNRRVGLKRAIHYLRTKGYPFRAENHKILNERFQELTGLKNPGVKFREWMGILYSQGSEFLPKPPKEIRRGRKKNKPELRRKKKKKTKSEDYQKYLLSPEWRLFRQKAFQHYGKVCKTCGSNHRLQVHHLHYKNIFHEQLEDVTILCEPCHEAVHGRKFVYS